MKRASGNLLKGLIFSLLIILLAAAAAWAKPTTAAQAHGVAKNWLGLEAHPMGSPLGAQIKRVQTFTDASGAPAYYVVYLNPGGLVFLPADDLVEPIIGFVSASTSYDPSPANPLGALVSRDIPGRVLQARQVAAQAQAAKAPLAPGSPQAKAQSKWAALENAASASQDLGSGLASISDVRVAPLVQSYWWQSTVVGKACFNYYTPPFATPDNPSNYVCGCVATAMAQLMYYHQYPTLGVGTPSFDIAVDGVWQTAKLRGGDGNGGPYDWANMPAQPGGGISDAQRQALGALSYDAGVSVNMQYTANNSVSNSSQAAWAYVNVFKFSNARYAYNDKNNLPLSNLYSMINPNLDSRLPVQLGINQSGNNGHSILADGYGYNSNTMYHHLNMGWYNDPSDNIWYNLPDFSVPGQTYDTVHTCVYNVFKSGTGEIISGRVTTADGTPIAGATVGASGPRSTTTNAQGIYAFAQMPSNTTFTVKPSKSGYYFSRKQVTTGLSTDNSTTTGNVWGVDFVSNLNANNSVITGIYPLLSD